MEMFLLKYLGYTIEVAVVSPKRRNIDEATAVQARGTREAEGEKLPLDGFLRTTTSKASLGETICQEEQQNKKGEKTREVEEQSSTEARRAELGEFL